VLPSAGDQASKSTLMTGGTIIINLRYKIP
jgi:hypothetical protein